MSSFCSLLPPMSSHCSYPPFHPLGASFNVISDDHLGAPLHFILILASLMSSFLPPSISSPCNHLPCHFNAQTLHVVHLHPLHVLLWKPPSLTSHCILPPYRPPFMSSSCSHPPCHLVAASLHISSLHVVLLRPSSIYALAAFLFVILLLQQPLLISSSALSAISFLFRSSWPWWQARCGLASPSRGLMSSWYESLPVQCTLACTITMYLCTWEPGVYIC